MRTLLIKKGILIFTLIHISNCSVSSNYSPNQLGAVLPAALESFSQLKVLINPFQIARLIHCFVSSLVNSSAERPCSAVLS